MAERAGRVSGLAAAARSDGIDRIQVLFADQHGLLKGRSVHVDHIDQVCEEGIGVPGSMLAKDTGGTYAIPIWEPSGDPILDELLGARNMVLRPDPATFRPTPWAPRTGLVLCDLGTTSGRAIPHSSREILRAQVGRLAQRGWVFRGGFEYEFHLYRRAPLSESAREEGSPVAHSHRGWDLLSADLLDEADEAVRPIVDGLEAMGLPVVTVEAELGPSQIELTLAPDDGVTVGDHAAVVRHAVKCLARANGFHATFMSRPALDGSFSSGWHLHQSLVASAMNREAPLDPAMSLFAGEAAASLSAVGESWVAGLLEHAASACLLTTPTVNGYKRFRPRAVTPDRITWSHQHRGAMVRVVGDPAGLATRVENRSGDPAANPYLYAAVQIAAGLDGIERGLAPPAPSADPYAVASGDLLPRSLGDAIDAFTSDTVLRGALGADVAEYLVTLKRSEWSRFLAEVTDWEQREYFDLF